MNEEILLEERDNNFNPVLSSLLRPRQTIRYVVDKNTRLYFGILIYLYGLSSSMDRYAKRDYTISPLVLILLFVFAPISGYISVYFYGWIMSLFGRAFGGGATNEELRISVLWSSVPVFIITPIALVTFIGGATNVEHVIYENIIFTIVYWLLIIVEITISVWCFINLVRMVSEVQGFTNGKAFLSIVLPSLIVVPLVIIVALTFNAY